MKIEEIKVEILELLANVKDANELNDIRVNYLGKKGKITDLNKQMKDLSIEEKKELGKALNELKSVVSNEINSKNEEFKTIALNEKLEKEKLDISLPSTKIPSGGTHPITKVVNEVEDLFRTMGYSVTEGPEVELDLYNFEKLNLPKGHPARDEQDSFYINDTLLLRTQTSPVQAREMEKNVDKGPLKILCPGKTYRRDSDDATHSHQFTQIEGLVIDEGISMAHLKGALEAFARKMFDPKSEIRFRPGYFPFTEPSFEVDITCFKCHGKGCSICKDTGWIEILGAGMVHPNVLEMSGYDSKKYTGFAFGMGPERIAMIKYGIPDIRMFYTNDQRFLEQFKRTNGGDNNESK